MNKFLQIFMFIIGIFSVWAGIILEIDAVFIIGHVWLAASLIGTMINTK